MAGGRCNVSSALLAVANLGAHAAFLAAHFASAGAAASTCHERSPREIRFCFRFTGNGILVSDSIRDKAGQGRQFDQSIMFNRTQSLLRTMLGPQADFRRNQWEAIEALAVHKKRVLVVERTG